ncbi:MAG: hypothetical protein JEZ14_15080 [Marinilabiliaceae bacterium]|nr:hypothetical protein [Marinilabiliaceae bacterium]
MKRTKAILALLGSLILSFVFGSLLANWLSTDTFTVHPMIVAGIFFILSLIPMPKGVLPMAITINSAYAGEVMEQLLVKATTGNELVDGGHIRLEPNVTDKFYIPRLKAGKMLQKVVEQPDDNNSKGDFNVDEKLLKPEEFMAFTTFNPKSFEKFWRKHQPKGPLVFAELPPHVQNQLLAELAKVVDFELGHEFINGEFGAGANQFFNGILTRIVADADVLKTVAPTAVAITVDNVISKLKAVRVMIPKALRKKKGLKIFMSIEDSDLYDDALTAQPNKGKNHTDTNEERYKGIPIVALADWPKDVIVAAVASTDLTTNFWGAVSFMDDYDTIQIDKLTNAGEKYFFKMKMKADTNTAFGEEIVLYDARP